MKSFKQFLKEKSELGVGSRVLVDQNRFRSGRDPGRRAEKLVGTIRKMGEDECMVEFDKHITIRGEKKRTMKMRMSYVSELVESFSPSGKGQEIIWDFLTSPGRAAETVFELSSIASDPQTKKNVGMVQFAKLQSAAVAMAKKGAIQYDGVSKVSQKSSLQQLDVKKVMNRMRI